MLTLFLISSKQILGFKQKIKNLMIIEFFTLPLNSYKIFQDTEKMLGGSIEGVFCLMRNDSGFYLATGNYIKNGEFEKVEDHFNKLNNYKGDDLQKVYLKTLKENAITESNQAGVGLIDVRRYNLSPFDFDIITDNNGFYLTAGVLIPFYI